MRMAVVLPQLFPELYFHNFRQVFETDFPDVDVEYLFYIDYKEAPTLLKDRQQHFNAVIFAGGNAFYYTKNALKQETIWLFLPPDGSDIYRALLVAMRHGLDITRLSIDTYDKPVLKEIYKELGYDESRLRIQCFKGNPRSPDYNKLVLDFHREHLLNRRVSGCITRLTTTAKMMEEASIPYIFANPTLSNIREQIAFAQKLVIAKRSVNMHCAVLNIEIHRSADISALVMNDYACAVNRAHIIREIYRFSSLVNGAVVEQGLSNYTIFSSRKAVKAQMGQHLSLLNRLVEVCPYEVLIGIGYGETVFDAHGLAAAALEKCRCAKHSCAVLLADDDTELHIVPSGIRKGERSGSSMEQWKQIAQETGIGVGTLTKIARALDNGRDVITARELAQKLDISCRSANRILDKLKTAGYAATAGNASCGKGRPAQIVRIFLEK